MPATQTRLTARQAHAIVRAFRSNPTKAPKYPSTGLTPLPKTVLDGLIRKGLAAEARDGYRATDHARDVFLGMVPHQVGRQIADAGWGVGMGWRGWERVIANTQARVRAVLATTGGYPTRTVQGLRRQHETTCSTRDAS